MSTGTIPSLIGPVDTGASFMIVSIQNNQPFILNGSTVGSGTIYYWESNLTTILASEKIGVFIAQGTLDALTINDSINNGGIAFRSDGVTITNDIQPATLKMSQSMFANLFPPDIFLSAVVYSMFNSNGATARILTTTSATGPTIPANNIIILPVLWYFNCTSSGSYNFINQPLNSIINWFCLVNPNNPTCSNTDIAPGGWTNLDDCTTGDKFTYCPRGDICGNNRCKGPCTVVYDDCDLSGNGSDYVCVFNSSKFFSDTQWWTSPYFIGAVIAIIIIIVIIIFVLIRIL